ncbi:hypothetical protein N7456_001104 [Penicillium angulare]|uniref:Uncharacterized protein n=1 Tax=Penicillium angulare TaxID=116970 RepID=A0A9W9GDE1_9EURO|nr:hypothetical protein N7456_001104 [Penicillium angulare]
MSEGGQGQFRSFALARVPIPEGAAIHPNTAFLTYKVPLVRTHQGLNLNLDIFYEYGIPGMSGLPQGWSFDIPYILDGRSLTINGRTYLIDFDWMDSTGYATGLKYINSDHKMFLRKILRRRGEPPGEGDVWEYELIQPNGLCVYFDAYGKPLENHVDNKSYLRYVFSGEKNAGLGSPGVRLESFEDPSTGRDLHVRFTYEGSKVKVGALLGKVAEISFDFEGVTAIKNSAGLETVFEYEAYMENMPMKAISKIIYPTGISSRYEYETTEFWDGSGRRRYLPSVSHHYRLDENEKVQEHTEYMVSGLAIGNTFTGFNFELKMAGNTDSPMDGDGDLLNFAYDVIQIVYDNDGNSTSQITIWFNSYHLPTQIVRWKVGDKGELTEGWKTTYSYDIPVDDRARTVNYQHPVSIEDSDREGDGGWKPRAPLSKEEHDERSKLASSYVW